MPVILLSNKCLQVSTILLLLVLSTFSSEVAAQSNDLSVSGYFKSYFFLFQQPSTANIEGFSTSRFRFHLTYQPRAWTALDAAYDIVPRINNSAFSSNALLFGQITPFSYRAFDLDAQVYPSESVSTGNFAIVQNIDRASVTLKSKPADFTIGRQSIAWGTSRIINPTDVLAPYTYATLDVEDRIGIDAFRARIPIGSLSEIDMGYVFGRHFKFENSAFFARTKLNTHKTDISLLAMGFRENVLAGFDLTRAISGAGFWLETAYVFADALRDYDAGGKYNYFRASTGMDYNFDANVYGFIEYHFNGAGTVSPRDYLGRYARPAYTEGSVYLMGRHYLIPGISYQITPLITLTGESLINMGDPSFFVTLQTEYNVTPNTFLSGGAFIGIGRKPAAVSNGAPVILASEFGSYPNIYFLSFRYYF